MFKSSAIALIAISLMGCNANENKSAKTSSDSTSLTTDSMAANKSGSEWVKLFDGKTTSGWHNYGKTGVGGAWKVEDSAFHLAGAKQDASHTNEGGDLITDEEYENFDLKLQWKISAKGNSGVIFNIHEDTVKFKTPWQSGPENQVVDNEGHPDGKIIKHQAGDLYDMISSSVKAAKPVGEWNDLEIVSNNGKLDIYLNSQHVINTTMFDENWSKLVMNSKFKAYPGFGTFKKGRIGLQDHGDEVWYRQIQIKTL